jgi:hypothetical protein
LTSSNGGWALAKANMELLAKVTTMRFAEPP